ncbi:hypothetical protein [Streptomyces virginiae]|uniref:hypothetical protein n=1 Tax=Streptomyces virginiae TaxID=1961 RepID=UPI0038687432|nr:hypothetical protein OG253_40160 [Streptomyces virginiae]
MTEREPAPAPAPAPSHGSAPPAPADRARLDRALDRLAVTFRGMTARADEVQCECHWGSPQELALLKLPDTELDPDLLHRTWSAPDWSDHGAVLRRVLPQFARELTGGLGAHAYDIGNVGTSFHRAAWQQWPAAQSAAVREFLHAWWAHTLLTPDPAVPVHELLPLCAEASADIGPWLAVWEDLRHPVADRHLTDTVDQWEWDLLEDALPWRSWFVWSEEEAEDVRTELTAWLVREAPARLRATGAPAELQHAVRLLGLAHADRWDDPHAPRHRYA